MKGRPKAAAVAGGGGGLFGRGRRAGLGVALELGSTTLRVRVRRCNVCPAPPWPGAKAEAGDRHSRRLCLRWSRGFAKSKVRFKRCARRQQNWLAVLGMQRYASFAGRQTQRTNSKRLEDQTAFLHVDDDYDYDDGDDDDDDDDDDFEVDALADDDVASCDDHGAADDGGGDDDEDDVLMMALSPL